MIVRFLTPARLEFLEAMEYYDSRTAGVGAEFIDDLERTARKIADNPQLGPVFEEGTRRILLQRFPFGVIYEVHADHVLIVAVAHHGRRPGYWRDRL